MKKSILFLVLISLFTYLSADNKIGVGFQLNEYQDDFGLGINITTPYYFNERVAIRIRANLMTHEYVTNSKSELSTYSNFTIGVVGLKQDIANNIRLYGEGGYIGVMPSQDISSKTLVSGGYGLFGFEFLNKHHNDSYFIEIGGVGISDSADNLPNSPIYSNGFTTSVGFRKYF